MAMPNNMASIPAPRRQGRISIDYDGKNMKCIKLTLLFLLSLVRLCLAQNNSVADTAALKKTMSTLTIVKLINGKQLHSRDLIVGPLEMEDLVILTRDEMKQNYSASKADLIMVVKLKPTVKLIHLKQILNKYGIGRQYRDYRLLCEDVEVEDPRTLLASEAILQNVVINENSRSINIITKLYSNTLKAREEAKLNRIERAKQLKMEE
jgi:hypothetical protein